MLSALFCYLWLQQEPPDVSRPPDTRPPPVATPMAGAPGATAPAGPSSDAVPPLEPPMEGPSGGAGASTQPNVRAPGSSLLNPALSFILDASFGYYGLHAGDFAALGLPIAGDDPTDTVEGFGVQEIEVAAQSAIDPYLEGAIFLTVPNLQGLEVEEGYLVTTSLPANLQIKAGTFRAQFGRNNTQHLHVQSFTRRPLMTSLLFGADGFRGPGAQVSMLLPLPWFATLYAEGFSIGPPEDTQLSLWRRSLRQVEACEHLPYVLQRPMDD